MAEAYLILRRRRKLLRVCGHRRVEVLNGYAEILGETEDLGLFKFIKLSLELYELVQRVLGNAAFSLGAGAVQAQCSRTLEWDQQRRCNQLFQDRRGDHRSAIAVGT